MNAFLETAGSLSVVLTINFLLLGAILAAGLSLVFKFTESVSPRLRYGISCAVFLLAVAIPLAATFKTALPLQLTPKANVKTEHIVEAENTENQNSFPVAQSISSQAETSESSNNVLDKFILFTANSSLGITLLCFWMSGICFLFYREAASFQQIRKTQKSWTLAADEEREMFDCPIDVPLYFDKQQSPGTVGLIRPAIVLPQKFPAELSLESKRFIMHHELSHAKWRDPLGKFLFRLVRNLFWISPALWLIESLADAEREAAADRAAIISLASGKKFETESLSYADTLLTVAKTFSSHNQKHVVGIGGAASELEMRVRRLLASSETTHRQIVSAIAACLLTGTLMSIIPLAAFSKIAKKSSAETSIITTGKDNEPLEEYIADTAISNSPDVITRSSVTRFENRRVNKSAVSLKPAIENPTSHGKVPITTPQSESQEIAENRAEAATNFKNLIETSVKEEAKTAELREPIPLNSNLRSLEPLPAKSNMTPLDGLKNSLQNGDNPAKKTSPGEMEDYGTRAANRAMPPNLPARTEYKSRYIPYPATRGPQ